MKLSSLSISQIKLHLMMRKKNINRFSSDWHSCVYCSVALSHQPKQILLSCLGCISTLSLAINQWFMLNPDKRKLVTQTPDNLNTTYIIYAMAVIKKQFLDTTSENVSKIRCKIWRRICCYSYVDFVFDNYDGPKNCQGDNWEASQSEDVIINLTETSILN